MMHSMNLKYVRACSDISGGFERVTHTVLQQQKKKILKCNCAVIVILAKTGR